MMEALKTTQWPWGEEGSRWWSILMAEARDMNGAEIWEGGKLIYFITTDLEIGNNDGEDVEEH
jgi:hypothetical protein